VTQRARSVWLEEGSGRDPTICQITRMGTSMEDGWRESSRPELLLVCSQELAAWVEHGLLRSVCCGPDRVSQRTSALQLPAKCEVRSTTDLRTVDRGDHRVVSFMASFLVRMMFATIG
jgi:hypothetical protein